MATKRKAIVKRASGVTSTSFYFSTEERARLDRIAEKEGGLKAALTASFDAYEARKEPTPKEALKVLAKAIGA